MSDTQPPTSNAPAAPAASGVAPPPPPKADIPTARLARRRSWWSPAWLIPILALALAGALYIQSRAEKGPRITILFETGNGIQPDDPVTFRGVRVGTVHTVRLSPDLRKVQVEADLRPDAEPLARSGTAFWIVRPEVSLTRVAGLETLVGPRYIAAEPAPPLPTPAAVQRAFVGLERPPHVGAQPTVGDPLTIILRAARLGSVSENSPVTYRDMKVGSVTRIAMAEDGKRIIISIRIEPTYAHLVRNNTKFWNVSGIGLDMGFFRGLKFKAESLETVLAGGIAFATPNTAGAAVEDGRQFEMEIVPIEDWEKWNPDLTSR